MAAYTHKKEIIRDFENARNHLKKNKYDAFNLYITALIEAGIYKEDSPYARFLEQTLQELYFYEKYLDIYCQVEAGERSFPIIERWGFQFCGDYDNVIPFPHMTTKIVKL